MAVGDVHVILAFSHQVLHKFFPKPPTTFLSHASAEVRGENPPERNFASTRLLKLKVECVKRMCVLQLHAALDLNLFLFVSVLHTKGPYNLIIHLTVKTESRMSKAEVRMAFR